MDLKELVQGYERNMKALDKALTKLETEAQAIHSQLEARKASRGRVDALQRKRANLASERESLRGEYAEASFEGDQDELERISDRREDIDEQIAKLTEEVNTERIVLNTETVDASHAASVAVQRDTLKNINVQAFIEKLTESLQAQATEINSRIGRVGVPSSAYVQDEYDRQRSAVDSNYAIQLSRERRLAKKDAERRAKMRPVSSTDQMHTLQGGNRKQPERITVTSKGQKVKTYTQRGGSDDEPDRTQVLSGEQVRAALAGKK